MNGVGAVLIVCSSLEYVMAQTPNRIRGIMLGIAIAILGFGALVCYLLTAILQHFPTATVLLAV